MKNLIGPIERMIDIYENGLHDYLKYIKFDMGDVPIMPVKILEQV